MGNKKNRSNRHVSTGKFKFAKGYFNQQPKVQQQKQHVENQQQGQSQQQRQLESMKGNRIINLKQLASFIEEVSTHSATCHQGKITLIGERNREGLASILAAKCSGCRLEVAFPTSSKITGVGRGQRWESNLAAVWGQMSTGGGHAPLSETMAVLGVPVMTKRAFIATEQAVGQAWWSALENSMKIAAEEERRHAIEQGSLHEGVPAISVIVDGGWSKRTHKHTYNAKSGVGIIIGRHTRKLLHVGVRNKYCSVCSMAEKHNITAKQHKCYKNWDGPSSSMESDIIVDGFREAEKKYGLRYTSFTGDGDSSVHTNLVTQVPCWGHAIQKKECANHAIKCYRGALERLVQEKPQYKGKGKLTATMRKKLATAARCAIKMRSGEKDTKRAVELLRQDLRNGPLHCFGIHSNCSTDYCKVKGSTTHTGTTNTNPLDIDNDSTDNTLEQSTNTLNQNDLELSDKEILTAIANQEEQFWEDALDEEDMETVRSVAPEPPQDVDPEMIWDIQLLVGRLITKADKLIGKEKVMCCSH